jgi:hypothetical protein
MKVTVPVGTPAAGLTGAIVALNVTLWPNTAGLALEVSDVVVEAWLTVWVSALEVLPVKSVVVAYTAVIEWLPTLSALLVNVATPLAFSAPVPSVVDPSLNVTVPVGTPTLGLTGATVAENVTGWLASDGLALATSVVVVAAMLMVNEIELVLVRKLPSPE